MNRNTHSQWRHAYYHQSLSIAEVFAQGGVCGIIYCLGLSTRDQGLRIQGSIRVSGPACARTVRRCCRQSGSLWILRALWSVSLL